MQNGLIDETDYRVLMYWLERKTPEETIELMDHLHFERNRQIGEMEKLVNPPSCIREKTLHFFGQTLNHRVDNCCEVCGLDLNRVLQKKEHDVELKRILSWEERLSSLFNRF